MYHGPVDENLNQFGEKIKARRSKFTSDSKRELTGLHKQRATWVQERYGYLKQETSRQLREFLHRNRNSGH